MENGIFIEYAEELMHDPIFWAPGARQLHVVEEDSTSDALQKMFPDRPADVIQQSAKFLEDSVATQGGCLIGNVPRGPQFPRAHPLIVPR